MSATPRPTALITGASAGIGLELARLSAQGGHDVILIARSEDALRKVAASLSGTHGVRAEVIAADLSDPESPQAIVERVAELGMRPAVLINNAGFGDWGRFAATDAGRQLDMIQVNIAALTQLTRLLLPAMLDRKQGRILNVASTAGFAPGPLMAVYYATKAYVVSLSEALANELKGSGVTVTALCPGPTRTGFAAAAGLEQSNLFSSPMVMDVGPVAQAGYAGMMRGKVLVVPGLMNKLLILSIRVVPRALVRAITRWLQEAKGGSRE
jgi:uncharacterized protein